MTSNQTPGAAPAGWYNDGSGRLRWWDGRQWTGHFATAGRRPRSTHLWWALSPAYTLGIVAFIPALHAALTLRRRALWRWAAALVAANVVSWALLAAGPGAADAANTPAQDLGALIAVVLAVVGTVHAFRVRDEVFRRDADPLSGSPTGLDPAIASSLAARQRRAEAVALSTRDPGLARDLRIGRPDLTRQYEDGGLVDVNHVPESFLVSHLGLTPRQARSVVQARAHLGGFQSANELSGLAEVPARTLDAIRDRIVIL